MNKLLITALLATLLATPARAEERKVLYWYDPMVPGQRFDKPGPSPFMDMELVAKYADEEGEMMENGGKPVVSLSAETVQKMGVRTAKAEMRSFEGGSLRATGILVDNERARRDVVSQVEGRVEDLKASAEGDRVKKGEVFYTLVSPDLTALQNDYIAALSGGLKDMAAAASSRLKLLGVDARVITQLAKTRKAYEQVPFYVPADGVMTRLSVRNGYYLKMGDMVGQIQDLSCLWVEAAVPEADLPALKEGDTAMVSFTSNAAMYEAKVDYIYPTIDAMARTGKVRLLVDNKDGMLKPAGYATVEFASTSAATDMLTVPTEAILRGKDGEHVIVALGGGKFQSRDVKTGATDKGKTQILSGLMEGEEVVASAQFLIDSESNLRESLEKLPGAE